MKQPVSIIVLSDSSQQHNKKITTDFELQIILVLQLISSYKLGHTVLLLGLLNKLPNINQGKSASNINLPTTYYLVSKRTLNSLPLLTKHFLSLAYKLK